MNTHRRAAVKLLVAMAAACALPDVASSMRPAALAAFMEGVDVRAFVELGQEYLALHSEDAEPSDVSKLLAASDLTFESQLHRLRRLMRADFDAGRIVTLSGWFVSRTEARLYASIADTAAA